MKTIFDLDRFRMGVFNLSSARFGKVAEIMIQQLFGYSKSHVKYYNLYDPTNKLRVEVGFSRAIDKPRSLSKSNVIAEIYKAASNKKNAINESDIQNSKFICNIQQLKLNHFDVLYYGIYFYDFIHIYKATVPELPYLPGFSNKQHQSSVEEAQMGLTEINIQHHKKYLKFKLSYLDLFNLLT